jgi:peptide/nickel transport system substrate-binding protein
VAVKLQIRVFPWLVAIAVLAAACTPAGPSRSTASDSAPRAPGGDGPRKSLTIAVQRELKSFARFTGAAAGGGSPGAGNNAVAKIAHNYLGVREGNLRVIHPQLALELPSVERGTWRVNPDGTMDTTWRLHPNVVWHDGSPFTAEDLVFGLTLFSDTDFPVPPTERVRQMESASAPDPHTFVVHWTGPNSTAVDPTDMDPMPRHLLGETYRTDKLAVLTSPYLTSEFVGLGPYRVQQWTEGVGIEFVRFDQYFRGRPAFDRIVLKYIADANAMLANMLAGAVDLVLAPSVQLDTAAEVKQRWEGTGNRVLIGLSGSQQFLRPQFRPAFAQPRNGAPQLAVRRALYHGIDRAAVAEASSNGLAPPADSWIAPGDPIRPQFEPSIPQYPYDPRRAEAMLREAGWTRGPDAVLVDQATGDRFEGQIAARPATGAERTLAVIADGWKSLGVQMNIEVLSPALAADRRTMGTQTFGLLSSFPPSIDALPPLHSSLIASDANRWTGTNFQGYSNPRVDALIDQIIVTIDPREQLPLHRQLVAEAMGDVALVPLYWEVEPTLIAKGVTGVTLSSTWNLFDWNKE